MAWEYNPDVSPQKNYRVFEQIHRDGAETITVCPVCSSSDFSFFENQLIRCRNPNFEWVEASLQLCGRCGTIMSDRVYQPEYYFEFINSFYDIETLELNPGVYLKPNSRKSFFSTAISPTGFIPKSILEIGCFEGATLDVFKYEYDAEVFGVEPTTKTLEAAVKNFPHLNGRVINDVIERTGTALADKKFDLIMSSYAFRQNAHPLETLEIVNNIITDDGFFYLDEGQFQDVFLTASEMEVGQGLFQQKNFYYSINGLIYLFEKFGFEYFASLNRHEADFRSGYQPRHVAMIFRRNQDIVPDERRIRKSKIISDAYVESFRSSFKSKTDIIDALNIMEGVT